MDRRAQIPLEFLPKKVTDGVMMTVIVMGDDGDNDDAGRGERDETNAHSASVGHPAGLKKMVLFTSRSRRAIIIYIHTYTHIHTYVRTYIDTYMHYIHTSARYWHSGTVA